MAQQGSTSLATAGRFRWGILTPTVSLVWQALGTLAAWGGVCLNLQAWVDTAEDVRLGGCGVVIACGDPLQEWLGVAGSVGVAVGT